MKNQGGMIQVELNGNLMENFDWANKWHKAFKNIENHGPELTTIRVYKNIVCRDGFNFSLQAGPSHYSEPKAIADKYEAWEIGFPSDEEPLWMEWQEPGNIPTESVYGWVPNNVVNSVIQRHGGIDEREFITAKLLK